MKKFTLDEIRTDSDGNVYLIGSKGVLRVKRINDHYSAADLCCYAPEEKTHKVLFADVPDGRNRLIGGIAF